MPLPWKRTRPTSPPPSPSPRPPVEPAPLGDVIQRGEAARRLLNDPTLAEAFAELREEAFRGFADSKPGESAKREEAYRILQALELVRGKLITYRAAARLRESEAAQRRHTEGPERL